MIYSLPYSFLQNFSTKKKPVYSLTKFYSQTHEIKKHFMRILLKFIFFFLTPLLNYNNFPTMMTFRFIDANINYIN